MTTREHIKALEIQRDELKGRVAELELQPGQDCIRMKETIQHEREWRHKAEAELVKVRQERDDAQVVTKYDMGRIRELWAILTDLTDDDDCTFDHHGYCQAHGWMATQPKCPHARAKEAVR